MHRECWIVTYTYADGHNFRAPSTFTTHGDACRYADAGRVYGYTYAVQQVCPSCEGTGYLELDDTGRTVAACPDCD